MASGKMRTVYAQVNTEVEVEITLEDFDDDDLIDEIRDRQISTVPSEIIQKMYEAYVFGRLDDLNKAMRELFYEHLGKIV